MKAVYCEPEYAGYFIVQGDNVICSESIPLLYSFRNSLESIKELRAFICEKYFESIQRAWENSLNQKLSYTIRYGICENGTEGKMIEETGFHKFSEDETYLHSIVFVRDVTTQVINERDLDLAAKVFHKSGESIIVMDANEKIILANHVFESQNQFTSQDYMGKTLSILRSNLEEDSSYAAMRKSIQEKGFWRGELTYKRYNGTVYPAELSMSAVKDEKARVTNYIGFIRDITEKREAEKKILELARFDSLTMLPNRHSIQSHIENELASLDKGETLAVYFIDLDNFKIVNDSLGHLVGDLYLKIISRRLHEKLSGPASVLARLGGDEFLFVVRNNGSQDDIEKFGEKIIENISETLLVAGSTFKPSASVGVATAPNDGKDFASLIKHADTAMYHAKRTGKNQCVRYTVIMSETAKERLRYELNLRAAIEEDELRVVYQPKIELALNEFTGVEALLRWDSKHLGSVSPEKFISLAEETGIILEIGRWVIDHVFKDMAEFNKNKSKPIHFAINFSPRQFHDETIFAYLREKIVEHGIDPRWLEIEITESSLMENVEYVKETLQKMRKLGILVSIDDFGTGYSSFLQLKNIDVDILKIDKKFVEGIEEKDSDFSILRGMVSMAHNMGMRVVAEGVETQGQAELLRSIGCNMGQGFYFAHPLDLDELEFTIGSKTH